MHDGWARHYDFIFDECFGEAFCRLTAETLAIITALRPAPGRVLDLGAGTGRIAIPLALLGYHVTAVEHSAGMADVLTERARDVGVSLDVRRESFLDFDRDGVPDGARAQDPDRYDLALAIFTVLNYVVSEEDVSRLARNVAQRLAPGGRFVFDVARRHLFASAIFESERLHREIDVRQVGPSTFTYRDAGCGRANGATFQYDEVFTMRYWRSEELLPCFAAAGLDLEAEVTDRVVESGSRWFVLTRSGLGVEGKK
jgi:SAM-dependent methyltransferase